MSERLCKNCKHWEPMPVKVSTFRGRFGHGVKDFAVKLGYGLCNGILDGTRFGLDRRWPAQKTLDDAGAFTSGDQLSSGLLCGPQWSCPKFEERP